MAGGGGGEDKRSRETRFTGARGPTRFKFQREFPVTEFQFYGKDGDSNATVSANEDVFLEVMRPER